jgi:uncharacterized protein YidB (DUF937 family)
MTALLAVLALAGYQNRDKIGEVLNGLRNGNGLGGTGAGAGSGQAGGMQSSGGGGLGDLLGGGAAGGLGGLLGSLGGGGGRGGLGDLLGGSSGGNILGGGLGGLLDQFRSSGLGHKADSWVGTGQNEEIGDQELHQALGEDTLRELEEKTGLSRNEILSRLSSNLPQAVDALTPEGRVPDDFGSHPGSVPRAGGTSGPSQIL